MLDTVTLSAIVRLVGKISSILPLFILSPPIFNIDGVQNELSFLKCDPLLYNINVKGIVGEGGTSIV